VLSAGLNPRRKAPAIGVTLPWRSCSIALEALDDRERGYTAMGALHWTVPGTGVRYGLALPVALEQRGWLAAILQIRVDLGS
jgi:hypothetical protein